MKRAFAALITGLLCVFAAVLAACSASGGARYIQLDRDSLTLTCGQSYALVAEVTSAEVVEITWSSSDDSVAGVEDGLVTAYAEGKATICAFADGKVACCEVTVTERAPEDQTDEDDAQDGEEPPSDGEQEPPLSGGETDDPDGESPPQEQPSEDGDGSDGEEVGPDDGDDGQIPDDQRGRAVHFVYFDRYEGGTQLYCTAADGSAAHESNMSLFREVQICEEGAQFGDREFESAAKMDYENGITFECYGRTEITLFLSSDVGAAVCMVSADGKKLNNFVQPGRQEATFVAAYAGVYRINFGSGCLLYALSSDGAAEGKEDIFPSDEEELCGIEVVTDGAKLSYAYGEAFSSDGVEVYGDYVCRAQARHARRLISAQVNFSGYDASAVGEQIIAVSYGEMVCTYTVTVAPELIEIGLNEEAATGGYIKDGIFFIPCKVNSPVGISPRIVCVAATSGEVAGWRMLVRSGGSNVAITDDYPLQLDAGSRLTVIIEADVRAEDGSISVFRREVVFIGIENNDAAAR